MIVYPLPLLKLVPLYSPPLSPLFVADLCFGGYFGGGGSLPTPANPPDNSTKPEKVHQALTLVDQITPDSHSVSSTCARPNQHGM